MLFPHLTVEKNIAFGLRQRRTSPDEQQTIVREISNILDISHLLPRYPVTLMAGNFSGLHWHGPLS